MHSSEEGTQRNGTPPKTAGADSIGFGDTLMRKTNFNIKDMVKDNSEEQELEMPLNLNIQNTGAGEPNQGIRPMVNSTVTVTEPYESEFIENQETDTNQPLDDRVKIIQSD